MKKIITPVLVLSLTLATVSPAQNAQAATKLSLSKSKITMTVGTSKTVSANKKVTWKTSNKKIATVKKVATKKAKISAKKAGSCKITATYDKSKAYIRVTVEKKASKPKATVKPTVKPKATVTPSNTPIAPTEPVTPSVAPTSGSGITPTVSAEATAVPASGSTITPTVSEEPMATPESGSTIVPTVSAEPAATPETGSGIGETASPAPTLEPASGGAVQIGKVTTEVLKYSSESVTFVMTNETGYNICAAYAYEFSLEKFENGEWRYVGWEHNPRMPIPCLALEIKKGESHKETVSLTRYGVLEKGTYRVVKTFNVSAPNPDGTKDSPTVTAYAEFTVEESAVEPSATPVVSTNPGATPAVATASPAPITGVVSQAGVSMTLESYANGKFTYTLTNVSENEIGYIYDDYKLQKNNNGTWENVEPARVVPVRNGFEVLKTGDSQKITDNILASYDLEAGTYRYVKPIRYPNAEGRKGFELMLPFEVTEEDVSRIVAVSEGGIGAIVEGYEDGILTYVLTNHLDHKHDVEYARSYMIQKENNGEWEDVIPSRYENVTDDMVSLGYGESRVCTENIGASYDLEPGSYRFVRIIYAKGCKCCARLVVPFEV